MAGHPTLVVIGASGDLAARLLFPSLLSLEYRERLEDLRIIGYARQEWTTEQFHENLRASIDVHGSDIDAKYLDRFRAAHDDSGYGTRATRGRWAARTSRAGTAVHPRPRARSPHRRASNRQ